MYSEMLGNKYFLARNYEGAAANFQYTLKTDPINKSVRKKLIICYTQIGQIQKAFENFYMLAKENINFITSEIEGSVFRCAGYIFRRIQILWSACWIANFGAALK
jgi:tetratricopeptide (TPR) repeat protein